MLRPAGNPVAVKVYGPPEPPEPTIVNGVIAKPGPAVIDTAGRLFVIYILRYMC